MAICIHNLSIRIDAQGTLEVIASMITVGMDAKQMQLSVFNPGVGSDPPLPPRREARVSPVPQPVISAAAPEPSPVVTEPTIKDEVVNVAQNVRDVLGPFLRNEQPKADYPGIKRFMSEGDPPPAPKAKKKKNYKKPYERIPPEQRKPRHSLKGPDGRHFIKRPPEPGEVQPDPSPAELTWEARKAAADLAAAEAMQKEAAAIIAVQKAVAAAERLKTPAAKQELTEARSVAFALKKVTKEAIRLRNLSRYKDGWEAERNKKGQIMTRPTPATHSEPEFSEPEPPQPSSPPLPPATDTALLLASAKKKFGVPPGQMRADDAPLAFP